MIKTCFSKQQFALRLTMSITVTAFTIAAYFAFGFFFDVFAEIVPILLFPLAVVPLFWLEGKALNKIAVITASIILSICSIAASSAVGVIATSKSAYGIKPVCGKIETYTYSRSYMKDTYNINQKTKIYIWSPDNYDPTKKYPVLYVLDGDNKFNYAAVEAAKHSLNGDGDMIVVGIGYGYWNGAFARGSIIWQDEKHLRGRWRDFMFTDDTQVGELSDHFGGESKRGKEYVSFLINTVVRDVRSKFNVDSCNSTIYGHSLGGGLVAYLFTQYNPKLAENNPFSNFVIADNAYLDYYNAHFTELADAMQANGNSAHTCVTVYRIWGGKVNPAVNGEQYSIYKQIEEQNWTNVQNYFYVPADADHGDTETIGTDNAERLILGLKFNYQNTLY